MSRQFDAFSIYELGRELGYLEGILDFEPIWGDVRESLQALGTYKTVASLEFIGLESQRELLSLTLSYKYSYKRIFAEVERNSLHMLIQNWYGRLAEIHKKWIVKSPETHLDIYKLCAGAQSFFSDAQWAALNKLEQEGLNEASACLLLNNHTACEFMSLRTVESVLRRWYEIKTGRATSKQAAIFDELEKAYPENQRPKEVSLLFYFKNRRNAIAHPDVISNSEEATVTFTHTVETCRYVATLLSSEIDK